MSKRKQKHPQQRANTETSMTDQDLLTCGNCQEEFSLRDICKFIEHKVKKCNKENIQPLPDDHINEHGKDDQESLTIIPQRRTSISAPIAHKTSTENRERASPRGSLTSPISEGDDENSQLLDQDDNTDWLPRPKHVDAESNTTHTEPNNFVCGTCTAKFTSAWFLLQHVQKLHGMKIYLELDHVRLLEIERNKQKEEKNRQEVQQDADEDQVSEEDKKMDEDMSPQPDEDNTSEKSHPEPVESREREENEQDHRLPSSSSREMGSVGNNHTFMPPFRSPFTELPLRPPINRMPNHSPYHRPGPDFRFDLMNDMHRLFFFPHGLEPPSPNSPFSLRHPQPAIEHLEQMRKISGLPTSDTDYYSQQLRLLAVGPKAISPASPSTNRHTPPFRPNPSSAFSPGSSAGAPETNQKQQQLPMQPKVKACEFCGKCFRFQSNLIVHRRSHTGEKPYKCRLCPHACTQASKLKRHMKTHQNKSPSSNISHCSNMSVASDNSARSTSSTPDSHGTGKPEDENELDSDEELMEEEDEEGAREELMQLEREMMEQQAGTSHGSPSLRKSYGEDSLPYEDDQPTDLTVQKPEDLTTPSQIQDKDKSLLSEVMTNSALASIQHINEAYQQALAESTQNGEGHRKKSDSSSEDITENGTKESTTPTSESVHQRVKQERSPSRDSHFDIYKRIKLEQKDPYPMDYPNTFPWYSQASHFPPTIDMFHHGPHSTSSSLSSHSNGPVFSPTRHPVSRLQEKSLIPGVSDGAPPPAMLPSNIPRKENRRNDTCEFCGKIFKNCSNLTVHRRSHTGEKPYKCSLCSYACAQSSKLTRHMKTHGRLGKDIYRCKFCNMPFSVPSTLEKHMRRCMENTQQGSHVPRYADSMASYRVETPTSADGIRSYPESVDGQPSSNRSFQESNEGRPLSNRSFQESEGRPLSNRSFHDTIEGGQPLSNRSYPDSDSNSIASNHATTSTSVC